MLQKYAAIAVSLLLMFAFLYLVLVDDFEIPQRETLMAISIKNKVNICLPEDDEDF